MPSAHRAVGIAAPAPFALLGGPAECSCLSSTNATSDRLLAELLSAMPNVTTIADTYNHSMLNMAARYGHAPAARMLIAAGADVSHADNMGHTPLHHLTHCRRCNEKVAINITVMLLDAGAYAHAIDKQGLQPWDKARVRGWFGVQTALKRYARQPPAAAVDSDKSCVAEYARQLTEMGSTLGGHSGVALLKQGSILRDSWEARRQNGRLNASSRVVLIGAGFGSTGTDVVAATLQAHGLRSWRATEIYPTDSSLASAERSLLARHAPGFFRQPITRAWVEATCRGSGRCTPESRGSKVEACHRVLNSLSYKLPDQVDAYLDRPSAEAFLDFWWAHPNARALLTTRDATEWARYRHEHYQGQVELPMDRPCGLYTGDLSPALRARLYDHFLTLVKCIVPPARLVELPVCSAVLDAADRVVDARCRAPMNQNAAALSACVSQHGRLANSPASHCTFNATAERVGEALGAAIAAVEGDRRTQSSQTPPRQASPGTTDCLDRWLALLDEQWRDVHERQGGRSRIFDGHALAQRWSEMGCDPLVRVETLAAASSTIAKAIRLVRRPIFVLPPHLMGDAWAAKARACLEAIAREPKGRCRFARVHCGGDWRLPFVERCCPEAARLKDDALLNGVARSFLTGSGIRTSKVMAGLALHQQAPGGGWHQDSYEPAACLNELKALIYLSNVNATNSPFRVAVDYDPSQLNGSACTHDVEDASAAKLHKDRAVCVANRTTSGKGCVYLGNHQPRYPDSLINSMPRQAFELYVYAPAGSVVIFDTFNAHRGTAALARDARRWSLTSYFTSNPPAGETSRCSLATMSPLPRQTTQKPPL